MSVDLKENKPWKKNQINNEKPNIQKTESVLTGYIANSFNGGHNKVIAWKQVMAGEKHKEFILNASIKMLTPLTPAYQNLICTIRTYFVPNSRVWNNAEKYTAQKGGSSERKVLEIPNIADKRLPSIMNYEQTKATNYVNTTQYRDSYLSSYFPRIGDGAIVESANINEVEYRAPAYSVLGLRGRKAIYNDYERNKEYDSELYEYKDDYVSDEEWNNYLSLNPFTWAHNTMRAKKNNSYYSDYRTELQGFEEEYPPNEMSSDTALLNWAQWETKIAEARSQAENAQLNDWDIIAKIRGSKKLTEGKVQLLSERSFNLNYSSVTQNSYSSNNNILDQYRTLGQQGAYSYTNINIPLYAGMEFVEEGYIHIIATVSADSVYETGLDRLEMNIKPLDQYRPDMLDDKKDVLYEYEMGTTRYLDENFLTKAVGFKRKYSEYFKLPNIINGDLTTNDWKDCKTRQSSFAWTDTIITQSTYQFFETSATNFNAEENYQSKSIWKDYTDYLIDKNQAIKNEKSYISVGDYNEIMIHGQNQIFMLGKCTCIADLPIDQSIKNNYTQWGEH